MEVETKSMAPLFVASDHPNHQKSGVCSTTGKHMHLLFWMKHMRCL